MKATVEKLITQLTDLKVEELGLQKRLKENRERQAAIIGSLQVKPNAETTAPASQMRAAVSPKRVASVLRSVRGARPAPIRAAATLSQSQPVKSEADRVREYINAAPADAIITTEAVSKAVNISTSNASNVLSRMNGKLIERVEGTKRGKFRKINRAA